MKSKAYSQWACGQKDRQTDYRKSTKRSRIHRSVENMKNEAAQRNRKFTAKKKNERNKTNKKSDSHGYVVQLIR